MTPTTEQPKVRCVWSLGLRSRALATCFAEPRFPQKPKFGITASLLHSVQYISARCVTGEQRQAQSCQAYAHLPCSAPGPSCQTYIPLPCSASGPVLSGLPSPARHQYQAQSCQACIYHLHCARTSFDSPAGDRPAPGVLSNRTSYQACMWLPWSAQGAVLPDLHTTALTGARPSLGRPEYASPCRVL